MRKLFFFLILFYCSCKSNKNDERINNLFSQAARTDTTDKLDSSVYYYSEILQIDSTNWNAMVLRSKVYVNLGQLDKAINDLDKVISKSPGPVAYTYRASAYVNLSDFDKAEKDFKTAISLDSTHVDALYGLSLLENNRGHYQSALVLCDHADAQKYNQTMSLYIRGQIYSGLGRYQDAIDIMKKMIVKERRSQNIGTYYNTIGFAENKLGRYDAAIGHLTLAIGLNPNSSAAYNNKAYALLKTGNAKGALQFVEQALDLNPENAYAYNTRGQIYMALNQRKKACEDLSNALSVSVDSILIVELNDLIKSNCNGIVSQQEITKK
jgi:tetratricopeptide (TPR) repeat protein